MHPVHSQQHLPQRMTAAKQQERSNRNDDQNQHP
jgi:hypothetical protein